MMEDLFKTFLSGSQQQTQGSQTPSDPLTGLLGALVGGGMSQPTMQQAPTNIPSAGGFASIINGILGGGGSNSITSSIAAPIARALADKLNLPPEIAQMVVTFVMGKLLSNAVGGPDASYAQAGGGAGYGRQGGFDLEDLLLNMDGGQGFDAEYLQSTGMVGALSRKTGLDEETATRSMQEVFSLLSGQSG